MKICEGYTPDGKPFRLVLENMRLWMVTDGQATMYNDGYYSADDDGSLRSIKASLVMDGYQIS